jgi:hypothetical protein
MVDTGWGIIVEVTDMQEETIVFIKGLGCTCSKKPV